MAYHVRLRFVADDSQMVGKTVRKLGLRLRFILLHSYKPDFSPGKCLLLGTQADLFWGWEAVADTIDGPSKTHFLPSLSLTELTFCLGIQALPQAMGFRGG